MVHEDTAPKAHMQVLCRLLRYCAATPRRGLLLKPKGIWDGDPKYKFLVKGRLESNYATDITDHCSVTRDSVFLQKKPVA
jgi:hypothetical protein